MSLIVEKYGGTSVADVERINAVADNVVKTREAGNNVVVVLSAMGGETNRLLGLAEEIDPQASAREMDVLVSTGEQVTIALLSIALQKRGCKALSYTGGQAKILTDDIHGRARILNIDSDRMHAALEQGQVLVVAGFQGTDNKGNITTLGRGGSDTTAVALAAALKADECRIYTDVEGVYTADPRIVPEARRLDRVTVEEMLEMASLGANVLQTRSVEFAGKYNVKLRVLSSFVEGPGTLITNEEDYKADDMEQPLISGIAHQADEAKVTLRGVPDEPGVAFRILGPIADAHINVDVIVQNVSIEGLTDFTFTIGRGDLDNTTELLNKICVELNAQDVTADSNIAKISVVGVGMRSHAGVATRMFKALADENINIQMISTSEIKISVIVEDKYMELATRTLHQEFGLEHAQAE
ncbi:MAG: aspartate kinase [Arenicellales bacterium WSBS_2016_MAG_OTU3]